MSDERDQIIKKVIKEIRSCKDTSSIKSEFENHSDHVERYKNIFNFMDDCKRVGATPHNSITFFDEKEMCMYIKYPYIHTFWR